MCAFGYKTIAVPKNARVPVPFELIHLLASWIRGEDNCEKSLSFILFRKKYTATVLLSLFLFYKKLFGWAYGKHLCLLLVFMSLWWMIRVGLYIYSLFVLFLWGRPYLWFFFHSCYQYYNTYYYHNLIYRVSLTIPNRLET